MKTILYILSLNLLISASPIKIVTWNVKDIMQSNDVKNRSQNLIEFANELKPDILIIQEITSKKITEEIKNKMHLFDYHIACSDFVQSDGANRRSFEVAIISRYPFSKVVEYDPFPDNKNEDEPEEKKLTPLKNIGISSINTARGYLWVKIDEIKLIITAVHLKSSRGQSGKRDSSNAKKREFVIGSVADKTDRDLKMFPNFTCIVAGDFNVGHSDTLKNGINLWKDCYLNCKGKDLYDETHALLHKGLVNGLRMRNLTLSISESTFPSFSGSPIDNIYVVGKNINRFSFAYKSDKTYGSDHVPVWTEYE